MTKIEQAELLARFDKSMRSWGAADKTRDARGRMAHRILVRFPDLNTVSAEELADWLADIGEKQWTRTTYHSHTRAFFGWLASTGRIDANPTADKNVLKHPKAPSRTKPHPLTLAEEKRALVAATGNVHTWLLLGLREGLRAHEIAKIRGEDVQEDLLYVLGKGKVEAYLPTHLQVWAAAAEYPRTGWWFPSPSHDGHISGNTVTIMTGRLFREVGIAEGSIHRTRHSFATSLLRAGVNIRQVQTLMRHASLETTANYTAVAEDELRAAVNLLGVSA